MSRLNIYIDYHKEDKEWAEELRKYFVPLERNGNLSFWDASDIRPGADINREVEKGLANSHIVLLLISNDYLADKRYIAFTEQLHRLNKKQVIPIIIRNCSWEYDKNLEGTQVLPRNDVVPDEPKGNIFYEKVVVELQDHFDKMLIDQNNPNFLLPEPKNETDSPVKISSNDVFHEQLLQYKYSCNRRKQKDDFLIYDAENKNSRLNYYHIHGQNIQSTKGLYRRFYHFYIAKQNEKKEISPHYIYIQLEPDEEIKRFKINFLDKLRDQLKGGSELLREKNIAALLDAICVRKYDVVCVGFRLNSKDWTDNVPEFFYLVIQ